MCDKYIDIGGFLIPRTGPLGLITDGEQSYCTVPSMMYPRAVTAYIYRERHTARAASFLTEARNLSFSEALDLLKCGARVRWHDWDAGLFIATCLEATPDERGVKLYESIDQSTEDFRVRENWQPTDAQMLWDGWTLFKTQKIGHRFYL